MSQRPLRVILDSVRRISLPVVLAAAAALAVPSNAGAVDVPITTQILNGGRGITSALMTTPIPNVVSGTSDGVVTVLVNETNTPGDADWRVEAELCDDADCDANELVRTGGGGTIAGSALSVLNRATVYAPVLPLADSDKTVEPAGSSALDDPVTLFTVTGQDTGLTYTALYTHTATVRLTVPGAAPVGTYTGVLRVTLVE